MQFRLGRQAYNFSFKFGMFLFSIFFIIVFCSLGSWQLHRYYYKKDLLQEYHHRLTAAPKDFLHVMQNTKTNTDLQFQHIVLTGRYANNLTMFVQNKFQKDQIGFEVFTPLQILGTKKLLLIDRGWVAKPRGQSLPIIDKVNGEQQFTGTIKLLNEYQFILGNNILDTHKSPLVMQKIDITEISRITQHSFYPFTLRLDASENHGYIRNWIITNIQPQRHLGYAIQWFAMAFVLLIAYFCFSCKRIKRKKNLNGEF